MFEDFSADQILPCKMSESRRWIVIYIKEYFNAVGLLYIVYACSVYIANLQPNVSDDNSYTKYTLFYLQK